MATVAENESRRAAQRRSENPGRPVVLKRTLASGAAVLLIGLGCAGVTWAVAQVYGTDIFGISEQIVYKAEQLKAASSGPVLHGPQVDGILEELKGLIAAYEESMVFAASPYPGEIMLGTTPGGDDAWVETLCGSRYGGLFKEIRLRRKGSRDSYLRINDIKISYSSLAGPREVVFNKSGRVKLYNGGVFKLALPVPMKVRRIRILVNHETSGLEVTGIPYETVPWQRPVPQHPAVVEPQSGQEVLLGTTPGGKDAWLETLCSNPYQRPVREVRLRRTGRETSYLRINDIELTYLTATGVEKAVFNQGGRAKLYYGGTYALSLPRPMRITRIRILVNHESTGLEVYGVY